MAMQISTRFTSHDWHELKFQTEEEWKRGISIFEDRVRERYLAPIDRIEACAFAGFSVIALDCLLIEMLQQFREGANRTPSGKSGDYFVSFLTETGFGKFFEKRQAELFYRHIRCGILHQAEVRGSSRVLIDPNIPMVAYSDTDDGLIVNRHKFHKELLNVFENYIRQLQDPSNEEVRARFMKKMKAVCRAACEIV